MKKFFTYLLIFFLAYLCMCFFLWLSFKMHDEYFLKLAPLTRYLEVHKEEVKREVFDKVFAQAAHCVSMTKENEKERCKKDTSTQLARVLHEEELAGEDGYNWPNDLHFVKRVNDSFYTLGWNGELKDISTLVKREGLSKTSPFLHLLNKECNHFNTFWDSDSWCETYASVDLGNNQIGYMVRLAPDTEEGDLLFMFVYALPFLILMVQSYLFHNVYSAHIPFLITLSLSVIVPFSIAFIIARFYKRKNSPGSYAKKKK